MLTLYGLTGKDRGDLRETMRRVNGLPGLSPRGSQHRDYTPVDVSTEYAGYFKIVDLSEGETLKLKVIDGAYPNSAFAGYVRLANARLSVHSVEFTLSGSGYIWIYTKNTNGTLSTELKNGGTLPDEERGEDIKEIGYYLVTNSVLTYVQRWTWGEYVITGKAG